MQERKHLGKQNRRRMNPESVLEGSGTNEEVSPANAPRTTIEAMIKPQDKEKISENPYHMFYYLN